MRKFNVVVVEISGNELLAVKLNTGDKIERFFNNDEFSKAVNYCEMKNKELLETLEFNIAKIKENIDFLTK